MTHCIIIKRDELQQQIDLRNHYMGEAAKRKDFDADTLQSSTDDKELFVMFAQRALNELTSAVALRFPSITHKIEKNYIEVAFDTKSDVPPHILPLLKQSITDYLVNETILQWLLLRQPVLAQPNMAIKATLHNNVQQQFAKIYNSHRLHRRATDLAGI
ncbi:MAG: hypothetical protein J6B18_04535 [Bacteroidaceae bacterium]|nr:hypothetical protein [Bacteroidaceae bacterium]